MMIYECPNCHSKSGVDVHGRGFCHACHEDFDKSRTLIPRTRESKRLDLPLPSACTIESLPEKAFKYLYKYSIKVTQAKKNHMYWSDYYQRLCIPIKVIDINQTCRIAGAWMRCLDAVHKTSEKCMTKWLYAGEPGLIYFIESEYQKTAKALVLVEDCISAIRLSEFNHDVLALCGTSTGNINIHTRIHEYNRLIVWLDGDEAGLNAARKIYTKYKLTHTIHIIYTKKDPKEFSHGEIKRILAGLIEE